MNSSNLDTVTPVFGDDMPSLKSRSHNEISNFPTRHLNLVGDALPDPGLLLDVELRLGVVVVLPQRVPEVNRPFFFFWT